MLLCKPHLFSHCYVDTKMVQKEILSFLLGLWSRMIQGGWSWMWLVHVMVSWAQKGVGFDPLWPCLSPSLTLPGKAQELVTWFMEAVLVMNLVVGWLGRKGDLGAVLSWLMARPRKIGSFCFGYRFFLSCKLQRYHCHLSSCPLFLNSRRVLTHPMRLVQA